ncbi:MAG: hypothetical protein R3C68_16820 [Myxococcota bacterium]
MTSHRQRIEDRLSKETGTLHSQGNRQIALVYPSPYSVGMSSLGFQTVYRLLNNLPDVAAERAFLPDQDDDCRQLLTYETFRPAGDFSVVAFSVAYELKISGLFQCMTLMGLEPQRTQRSGRIHLLLPVAP